jgi:peptide chain release factor subunit 1
VHVALAELLAWDGKGWVVSCYQKLEPGDRAGEKYRIKLKNRIRRAAERLDILGFSHEDREMVLSALEKVEDFFHFPSNLIGGRGVAVFAGKGFFRAVRLPYVLRSRVLVDRTPVVSELVALAELGSRLLVAVADRKSARLFDVGLDRVEEMDGLVSPGAMRPGRFHTDRDAGPGVGEYRYHNRIREEKHRHLALVADTVGRAFRAHAFDGLVVGGIGVDANALLPHLGPEVRDKVVGVLKLAPKQVTPAEIRDRAMELLAESAETAGAEAVGELTALRENGWATDGVEATLRALARGQVRTLIADHDAIVPGFRLAGSGRLTELAATSRAEGDPVPVVDVIDDAIEEALRQRARVAVVRGPMARRFDQLAGLLRFRTPR